MQITNFTISSDKSKLNLTITDAASVISLRLWSNKTYKDFSKLIDLSAKLTSSATENIEITPGDLGISYFDGIYYIEAEDPDETSLEFTYELSKYKECILVRSLQMSSCTECINQKDNILVNIDLLLSGLQYALDLRYVNEMQLIIDTLDKFCTNECTTCGGNVEDISDYENSNPDTIDIIVDGGSLD